MSLSVQQWIKEITTAAVAYVKENILPLKHLAVIDWQLLKTQSEIVSIRASSKFQAEVGKNFLLMLSSHLLLDTKDHSCSLIFTQNFESVPQTHTHEDGDRRSKLMLIHTHFPKHSLLLTLIVVNTRQFGTKLMKKIWKRPFASNVP